MINSFSLLKARLRQFGRDLRGGLSVETVLIFPLLTWTYAAMFVFFDAFRAQNTNLKAAYTISDMISRETDGVSANYVEGLGTVFDYLTSSPSPTWIRVTVLYCNDRCYDPDRELRRDWSYATGEHSALTTANIQNDFDDKIPIIPPSERLILVETFMEYYPLFNIGLNQVIPFENYIVTRPRFAGLVAPGTGITEIGD